MSWIRYGLCTLVLITLGSCFSEQNHPASTPKESSSPKKRELSLPEKCRHLLTAPDPSAWNDTTHLYTTPVESEWAKCMGVGKVNFQRHMFRSDT